MRQPGNLIDVLIASAEHDPGGIAFSYLDDQCNVVCQLSNEQLHTRAAAIAGRLQQMISPSDRVLLLFPQGLKFIYTFMGVMYSGAIPVVTALPRDTQNNDDRICHIQNIVEEAGCNVVLTSTSVLNEVVHYFFRSTVLSEKVFLSVEEINDDLMDCWSMPLIESNSVACLQQTSAKKGKPKLVMASHYTMKNVHENIRQHYSLTASSRSMSWLPHYHYLGLMLGILQPLYCGCRGYIYSPFDFYKNPRSWLDAIEKHDITFSGAPDFAYSMCVEQDVSPQQNMLNLSGWNTAYNSGEQIKKETMDAFLEKFGCYGLQKSALTSLYGLAESVHVASGETAEKNQDKNIRAFSCGPPGQDVQVAIVFPGTRTECGEQETGEILVNSACNAIGYWNRPGETEKILTVYLEGSGDGPYLRTGDMGFIKEGNVHVVGKIKDDRSMPLPPVNVLPGQLVNEKSTTENL